MELIGTLNGITVLDIEAGKKILELEVLAKQIKEAKEELKKGILREMEERGIIKLEDEVNGLIINYIAETSRESFDTKKFKAENPDMYDEYVKMSTVEPSIRIKVKEVL